MAICLQGSSLLNQGNGQSSVIVSWRGFFPLSVTVFSNLQISSSTFKERFLLFELFIVWAPLSFNYYLDIVYFEGHGSHLLQGVVHAHEGPQEVLHFTG